MTLVSETFQKRIFAKGEMILPQSRYSPTNALSKEYYASQETSKFAEKIKTKKVRNKKKDTFQQIESVRRKTESLDSEKVE